MRKIGAVNLRIIVFIAVVGLLLGYPLYIYLDESLSKGVKDYGDVVKVNLKAMSSFEIDPFAGTIESVPPEYRKLDGRRVELEGEMYTANSSGNQLSNFELVYSIQKCCVTPTPKIQHFVLARSVSGKAMPYFSGLVRVTGKLKVKIENDAGKISRIYTLDVERLEPVG